MRARWVVGLVAALLVVPSRALADTVLVLPFRDVTPPARGGTPPKSSHVADAEQWAREALTALGHTTTPHDTEARARATVKDGAADTSAEFAEAGRSAAADWTVVGTVQTTEEGDRVELFVYGVQSARLESLARDLAGKNRKEQVQEMLALLVSAKGASAGDVVWKVQPTYGAGDKPRTTEPPPCDSCDHGPEWAYGAPSRLLVSVGAGGYAALARPSGATGSSATLNIEGALGYAVLPSLELRAQVGGSVAGPSALHADGGARYAFHLSRSAHVYAGPEATLGAFFPIGGDKTARFLARGAGFLGVGFGQHVQVEAEAEILGAIGGTGSLVLGGGSLRGGVRF